MDEASSSAPKSQQEANIHSKDLDDEQVLNDEQVGDVDLDVFKAVMSNIRLEKLAPFASAIRKRHAGMTTSPACRVLLEPLFGSFHILYQIQFEDEVRWLLKVPATGYKPRYDDLIARGLASEAQTMQVLKRETTIPVPEILQFDDSLNNELNCPYILMEHVDGIPLQDSWFDHRVSHDILEQRRVTTLRQVAAAMIQLDKFTYDKGGQVAYSKDGHSTTVGPMKCMDSAAELARLETDDTELTPMFCELGPFEDQSSFLLSLLNRRNSPPDEYSRGINEMLRLFISWIPNSNANEFVLSHPDFDMQNVLVSEDGSLRSLIDWDGVAAVPRVYAWDEDAEPNETVKENSPEELAHYRDIYADAVGSAVSTSDLPISLTRNSLIVENVRIAADDPFSTHGIVERIFHEITKLVAPEILEECPMDDGELEEDEDGESTHGQSNAESTANEQDDTAHSSADEDEVGGDDLGASSNSGFYSYEVAIDLASGKLDQKRLGMLKDGFLRLFMQCSPQAVQPRPGPLGLAWWAGLVGLVLAPFRLGKRDAGEEKK